MRREEGHKNREDRGKSKDRKISEKGMKHLCEGWTTALEGCQFHRTETRTFSKFFILNALIILVTLFFNMLNVFDIIYSYGITREESVLKTWMREE